MWVFLGALAPMGIVVLLLNLIRSEVGCIPAPRDRPSMWRPTLPAPPIGSVAVSMSGLRIYRRSSWALTPGHRDPRER